ncbi:MAG: hypothetical protein JNM52_07130 [Betaproteobacteria bacterium]|nr:hypothetical protein [Betaproteobacteria bacterium]
MSQRLLIIAAADDVHAEAVAWGLSTLGHVATIWTWADFPCQDVMSWTISDDESAMATINIGEASLKPPFDAVWYRRRSPPTVSTDSHEADIKVIRNESFTFLRNLVAFLGNENTRWINKPIAAQQADNKMLQLAVAKKLGFLIPDTIVSNDFHQVRKFFDSHNQKIIYKAFHPGGWFHQDGSSAVLRTAAVLAEHFEDESTIKSCPGIFQALIDKSYELRITVIGDMVFPAAIHSQVKGNEIDWRYDGTLGQPPLEKTTISMHLAEKCRELCRALDLVFGCIDLIVMKSGDICFLEINEAGQFLWKDKIDPSFQLLNAFSHFFAYGLGATPNDRQPLSLEQFHQSEAFSAYLGRHKNHPALDQAMFSIE